MVVSAATKGGKWTPSLSPLNTFPISSLPSSPLLVHKFSKLMMLENIQNAELIILKWDSNSPSISRGVSPSLLNNRNEAEEFMKCVYDLRGAMHFLLSENSASASNKLVLAQNLIEIAMKRLDKELCLLLSSHRVQLNPESVSEDEDEMRATYSMSDLKSIADCMISAGYGNECIKTYKLVRKSIVEETIYRLGIERIQSSQIRKLNWEVLENMIKNWQNAVQIAVGTVFAGEKTLCDHVFSSSRRIRESCFFEIIEESAMNLFRFPELVAKTKKSPERIFPLMELYKTLLNLLPEIEVIYSSESTSSIQLQVLTSLHRLGESVRGTLSDFEATIQKDSSKTSVVGGGIHPLTQTVMTYISSLADYSLVLSENVPDSPLTESNEDNSAVSVYLAWLIVVLLCKLDRKAKAYKDVALSYLFLANNLQFVVQKACESNLKSILGADWISEHSGKVKKYAAGYELMAWNRVFSSLPDKNLVVELSCEGAKQCFQRFNAAFEEEYKKQTTWIVQDPNLRDEMKVSIARKLGPVYRDFYYSYSRMVSGEMNSELLIRFAPDDLENYLSDLFHGDKISDDVSLSTSPSSLRGYCIPR